MTSCKERRAIVVEGIGLAICLAHFFVNPYLIPDPAPQPVQLSTEPLCKLAACAPGP